MAQLGASRGADRQRGEWGGGQCGRAVPRRSVARRRGARRRPAACARRWQAGRWRPAAFRSWQRRTRLSSVSTSYARAERCYLCHQSKKNEFGGEVSPPCPVTGLEDVRATPRSPLQRLRGGLWQGRCCSLYGMVRGRLRRPRWRWEGRRRWQRGTGREGRPMAAACGGEQGGRRCLALSVHIIGQYRSTCATSNENHQNRVQVLKVNGFGSWGTDPRRFCS